MAATRKRELDALIEANRNARRSAVKRMSESKAAAKHWELRGALRNNVLALYHVSGGDLAPVQHYLRRAGQKRHWSEIDDLQLKYIITDTFCEAPPEEVMTLTEATAPSDARAMRFAHDRMLGWRAAEWTLAQNSNGLTPATSSLLRRIEAQRKLIPATMRPKCWGHSTLPSARMRMVRWREEHSGTMGIYSLRDYVPQDEMRSKATAAWQWYNYLHDAVVAGKVPLRINFDETAVCFAQHGKKGNLLMQKRGVRRRFGKKATRAYLTHVAFICDDRDIQQLLPQVLIGNEHTLKAADMSSLKARLPANTKIIRARSSWVNEGTCRTMVKWLHDALGSLLCHVQPILLFDAYKGHLTPSMWNACADNGIWPILAPARMTWCLQPLDTHGFAAYKRRLHDVYQELCAELPGGVGGIQELVDSVVIATREVLNSKSWADAFDRNGFSAGQKFVPTKAWQLLGVHAPINIGSARPTAMQIRCCCPSNYAVDEALVWKAVTASLASTSAPATSAGCSLPTPGLVLSSAPSAAASSSEAMPICARTRSKSKYHGA